MSKQCTWEGCDREAEKPQISQDGIEWASLCPPHDLDLQKAVKMEPRISMHAWILAQGGKKAALKRMGVIR